MNSKTLKIVESLLLVICLLVLVGCGNVTYTLTYNLNGGLINGNDEYAVTITEDDDKVITLEIPSKKGYNFLGWYLNEEKYTSESFILEADTVLDAKWEVITYSITYDPNGGELSNKIDSYTCEDEITLPVPTKEGYKFLGWDDLGLMKIEKGTTGDLELVAKWGIGEYSITYNLNGGVLNDKIDKFLYNEEVNLPTPIKDGYKFKGWYLTADFMGNPIVKIEKGTSKDIELFASWIDQNSVYDITYNLNGGILSEDADLEYYSGSVVTLPVPTKDGYLFLGWYENKELSDNPVESILENSTGDKTYYASWLSAKELFNNFIPKTVTSNLNLYKTHPDNSQIKINWNSSDKRTINLNGEINQGHRNINVDLTMTLTYKNSSVAYTSTVKVGPVIFDQLIPGKLVAGYVYSGTLSKWGSKSFDKIFTDTALDTLDVVNYGFATVSKAGNLQLDNTGYTTYLEEVLKLRKYGIRVLLCIAENSANFSNMAYTQEGIDKFVSQVVDTVEKYHFDGVDIDWEFPGVDSGHDVTIDRPNYTKLMKALREGLDARQNKSGTPYLLTAAIPGTSWGSERYELNVLDEYLDYVNMMSYDLNNTIVACHHSNLYTSTAAKAYGFSIQYGVDRFVSLGFDKNKIVAGMAFYGKYYTDAVALGVDAKFKKNIHYTTIKNTYLNNEDFVEYWDEVAKASYLLNKKTKEFISFDSPRSIIEKCNYAKNSGIMGVMFWDYSEDTTGDLMKAINQGIRG